MHDANVPNRQVHCLSQRSGFLCLCNSCVKLSSSLCFAMVCILKIPPLWPRPVCGPPCYTHIVLILERLRLPMIRARSVVRVTPVYVFVIVTTSLHTPSIIRSNVVSRLARKFPYEVQRTFVWLASPTRRIEVQCGFCRWQIMSSIHGDRRW
jgi:hypothetical protein